MRTIISRLYSDASAANAAHGALREKNRIGAENMTIVGSDAMNVGAAIRSAGVPETNAAAYEQHMSEGRALLVVRAPYGAARRAMETLAGFEAISIGLENENVYVSPSSTGGSVITSHPLLASNPFAKLPHGPVFGKNPVIHSPTKSSAISGGAYMSKWFMPLPLLSRSKTKSSAISGGKLFSAMFGMPTTTRKKRQSRVW